MAASALVSDSCVRTRGSRRLEPNHSADQREGWCSGARISWSKCWAPKRHLKDPSPKPCQCLLDNYLFDWQVKKFQDPKFCSCLRGEFLKASSIGLLHASESTGSHWLQGETGWANARCSWKKSTSSEIPWCSWQCYFTACLMLNSCWTQQLL